VSYLMLAIDFNDASIRAVDYVGRMLDGRSAGRVLIAMVAKGLPSGSSALRALEGAVPEPELHGDADCSKELVSAQELIQRAAARLLGCGLEASQISSVILPDCGGVPQSLLDEAHSAGCDTLVVGRREDAHLHHLLLGSVSSSLIEKASGVTIWVVA